MNCQNVSNCIINWLNKCLKDSKQKGFVVGVSGGIDSAVVSTLCALTGKPVVALNMPINQVEIQFNRAVAHIQWLKNKFNNIESFEVDLTTSFQSLIDSLPESAKGELALVNTRSRLRMLTLYSFANTNNFLVCGTGNKVEDFGIGFFTKYGDGGVDISPIADLYKSEVYELGRYLEIIESILTAVPTDGLWEIDKTDEDQIGATYDELEFAMKCNKDVDILTKRQQDVLEIYNQRNRSTQHKMRMPLICNLEGKK